MDHIHPIEQPRQQKEAIVAPQEGETVVGEFPGQISIEVDRLLKGEIGQIVGDDVAERGGGPGDVAGGAIVLVVGAAQGAGACRRS